MKPTPHIEVSENNVIAKTVLMPGDPLRAKHIAEKYLDNYVCFNQVRGMLGYTGYYKGHKISVMGSGMGMPSIGVYSYELFNFYDVENIIRIGSAGSYCQDVKIFDVVLADASYSESTFPYAQAKIDTDTLYPSKELNEIIKQTAKEMNTPIHQGKIHSSDVFYHQENIADFMREEKQCLCVEMEAFSLFHNANISHKRAACILTISDSLVTSEVTTSLERQTAFNKMVELALNASIKL